MGEEADADWDAALIEWGYEDAERMDRERRERLQRKRRARRKRTTLAQSEREAP